jgi:hypothetical protein
VIYIAHRINTVAALQTVPVHVGVELDLRDLGEDLILQHDPFKDGERFEDYLKTYRHGCMILNIKSERIEYRVLELIRKYGIKEYFFLDSSFPMLRELAMAGEHNMAVRFSELEGLDTVTAVKGLVRWVWVDCFSKLSIDKNTYRRLKDMGFRFCLVSPELQGRPQDVPSYAQYLLKEGIVFDAICSKLACIERWKKFFPGIV